MFGNYTLPTRIEHDGVVISVEEHADELFYKRQSLDETEEKVLLLGAGRMLVHPVEPMNKPKNITPYLLIELEKPLIVEPKAKKRVFLKFPVEIGVFLAAAKELKLVDIITLVGQRYTLYGDPRTGAICRHWKSEVFPSIPEANPLLEGVMELRINNDASKWAELNKVVFNGYGMKIYHSKKMVSLKAKIRINPGEIADVDFEDTALQSGMKKSIELLTLKMLTVTTKTFTMESGL